MAKQISYSQYSMWKQCPWRWKLNYIDGHKEYSQSISTIFGTAMHETMQSYLTVAYNESGKKANEIDLNNLLKERMSVNFKLAQKENNGTPVCTKDEMIEHYSDGVEILNWFKKNRKNYFGFKGYELYGVEVPLNHSLRDGVKLVGFIDIVIKDKIRKKYKIIDLKTSTYGWNKNQKGDDKKTAQVIIYKKYFSEQYDIPTENIDVEFIILKRKLFENAEYTQKRIQSFKPANGKVTINRVTKDMNNFLDRCFDENGEFRKDTEYTKEVSDYNCKYCEFNNKPELCTKKNTA